MKIKKLTFGILISALSLILYSFVATYPGGSPGGYTGSPTDGANCTACHGGSATTIESFIFTDIPAEGYVPGVTYNISVTYDGSGDKGFELTSENSNGDKVGTYTIGSGTKLSNGGNSITHSAKVSTTSANWAFTWTAPEAGTGTVDFFSALVVNEPNTKLCSISVNEATSSDLSEVSNSQINVYPNPASDVLNVVTQNFKNKEVAIYNQTGKLCIKTNIRKKSEIDISNLASGVYNVVLSFKDGSTSSKFIKK